MSFFSKLLGLQKDKKPPSKGYILGGDCCAGDGVEESLLPKEKSYEFDVTFTETRLGCQLGRGADECSYVFQVEPGAAADANGVQKGDKIVAIDGDQVSNHDLFLSSLQVLGRPIVVTFLRDEEANMRQVMHITNSTQRNAIAAVSSQRIASSDRVPSSSSSSNSNNSINKIQTQGSAERQARRELMAAAALERGQAWDKRSKQPKAQEKGAETVDANGRPIYDHSAAAAVGDSNAETQRTVEAARRKEREQAVAMGYNPFQPHMSFSGNTVTPVAPAQQSALAATSNKTAQIPASVPSSAEDLAAEEGVDGAFALLLSVSGEPGAAERVDAAVNTALKMLSNLRANPDEIKYRSIRLANEAFQSRVGSLPGGMELFLAAGFEVEERADGLYLHHRMDEGGLRRLQCTVRRIVELQES